MVEYKVELQGSNGKSYVITYGGLWDQLKKSMTYDEKMGWNGVTKTLRQDVSRLTDVFISEILVPKAKQVILAFLKENPNVQTRNFYHKDWLRQERSLAWRDALLELDAEGLIVSQSHGRGQNRTWSIKQ